MNLSKILDFGIAKVASENNVRATQTGEISVALHT